MSSITAERPQAAAGQPAAEPPSAAEQPSAASMPDVAGSSPNLVALLSDVKDGLLEEMYRRVAAAGYPELRPSHGCVFRYLEPDGSRLADLAEKSGMTKQAFGEHLANVEALGYIVRVPDPADGRAKLIVPTPRGREALLLGRAIFAELEREWAEAIGGERIAALRETLEQINALQHARSATARETPA